MVSQAQWARLGGIGIELLQAQDEKNALNRCPDKLLKHKQALLSHFIERWQDLFGAQFDVLLYDLTSTYFDSGRPDDQSDHRRYVH